MHHVAIMLKSWGLTQKILSGEKRIESRWYRHKRAPWDKVREGDIVFFKEGKFVTAKAGVEKVLQFDGLTEAKVKGLLNKYANDDGIGGRKDYFFRLFMDRKYCILMFLKNPEKVQFEISKKGFGNMATWMCVGDINDVMTCRVR